MTFQVPQFGADFVNRVVKRVECLITLATMLIVVMAAHDQADGRAIAAR